MKLYVLFILMGFLLNSVMRRIFSGDRSDLLFPAILLFLTVLHVALSFVAVRFRNRNTT
jgi:hypothetical protein